LTTGDALLKFNWLCLYQSRHSSSRALLIFVCRLIVSRFPPILTKGSNGKFPFQNKTSGWFMNKGELVDAVAAKTNITKKQTDEIISAFLSIVTEAVANGDKVTLIGFGSFERRDRSEREGRNPKTNEPMTIPATKVPAFSAGKQFKEKVAP
jgi:DNA-binding protein HU-beta